MIATDDVCGDAILAESFKPFFELELRPDVLVCAVVDVTCDQQEVDCFPDTEVYYLPPGTVGCIGQFSRSF